MIVLFTDFGLAGPYTGQMKAVLAGHAPAVPVIDLFADAPAFQPCLSAYLLGAYCGAVPQGGVLPGLAEGLVGQSVGSQVLLVIPPGSDGAVGGEQDTLVLVVDLLAAAAPGDSTTERG